MVSTERVRTVAAERLGHEVTRVRRLQGSVANQDFVIEFAAHPPVVLKTGPVTEIAAETWSCERLTAIGVPVPRIVASHFGSTALGAPFLILSFVEGQASDHQDVAREAGRWLRRVHQEQLVGWGPVTFEPQAVGGPAGRYPSWREAVVADLSGLGELVVAGLLDAGLAERARTAVGVGTILRYDGPGVLLHNDLKPAHLFATAGQGRPRLSAIIDWGDASVGDPAAELARLSMSGPTMTRAFLDGYGVPLTDELAARLARYRVVWNVRALTYEHRAGGDWFDAYRNGIREDVALLLG